METKHQWFWQFWSLKCYSAKYFFLFFRYTLPLMEGKPNVTILDSQIRKLRSRSLSQIHEAAMRMRSEATEVKSTLVEIEDWLDKLIQLTEEVGLLNYTSIPWYERGILWNGTENSIGGRKIQLWRMMKSRSYWARTLMVMGMNVIEVRAEAFWVSGPGKMFEVDNYHHYGTVREHFK